MKESLVKINDPSGKLMEDYICEVLADRPMTTSEIADAVVERTNGLYKWKSVRCTVGRMTRQGKLTILQHSHHTPGQVGSTSMVVSLNA